MFLILSRAIRQQLNDFLLELSIIEMEGDCFPFCGLERTYCSGLLEQRGSAPVCPPHHVGYVLRSWIPSLLKELDWLHCLQNKDNSFQAWRSELLQVIPRVHQQLRLISQCADSCILCPRHPCLLPSDTSQHLPGVFFSLLLHSPNSYWNCKTQIRDPFICKAFSSGLIWEVSHCLLCRGNHSYLYYSTCLPHCNLQTCTCPYLPLFDHELHRVSDHNLLIIFTESL